MTAKSREQTLEACRAALEAHYALNQTIPSIAGLAALWGYASKSSASRRVDQLIEVRVLRWSADHRLAPGPAFAPARHAAELLEPLEEPEKIDTLGTASAVWARDYGPTLGRSYHVTTRLLRIARGMERHMALSAAREGLTSGDVLLLDALHRVGPPHRIAPTALKRHFVMSLAGVTKRVDRLERLGFIRRVPNPDDGRGLFIELTEDGNAALLRLVDADRAAPHIVWPDALSPHQYAGLLEALEAAEAIISEAD